MLRDLGLSLQVRAGNDTADADTLIKSARQVLDLIEIEIREHAKKTNNPGDVAGK